MTKKSENGRSKSKINSNFNKKKISRGQSNEKRKKRLKKPNLRKKNKANKLNGTTNSDKNERWQFNRSHCRR